jgi:hypothetical protein
LLFGNLISVRQAPDHLWRLAQRVLAPIPREKSHGDAPTVAAMLADKLPVINALRRDIRILSPKMSFATKQQADREATPIRGWRSPSSGKDANPSH